jgi:hypothetical protein
MSRDVSRRQRNSSVPAVVWFVLCLVMAMVGGAIAVLAALHFVIPDVPISTCAQAFAVVFGAIVGGFVAVITQSKKRF